MKMTVVTRPEAWALILALHPGLQDPKTKIKKEIKKEKPFNPFDIQPLLEPDFDA